MAWRIGESLGDGRLSAPAAERNRGPILEVLSRVLPSRGLVLEIGSGTGQHVVHFARSLPRLRWQPSDLDPELRRSTSLWIRHEALSNVSEPIALDIMRRPWPIAAADAIVCINVLHVSPWESGLALLEGARDSLAPGGVLFLYGPYRWRNLPTAPSNEKFDADLRAHDPAWGLREAEAVAETAAGNGLALVETVAMPANNLSLIFRR